MQRNEVRERMLVDGPRALSDGELLAVFGAGTAAGRALFGGAQSVIHFRPDQRSTHREAERPLAAGS
jgi:DNA repair protein RadC